MNAIETAGRIDKDGVLHLITPLQEKERSVRVIVLMSDGDEPENETSWLKAVSKSPSLSFLDEPCEDVYTLL
jgi:hypothetical protein